MKKAVCALALWNTAEAAKTIEIHSTDLSSNHGLDNIKAKWSETLKVFGRDATIEAEYDRNKKENYLSEARVSGKVDDVSYEVKTDFEGDIELTLTANTKDGTSIEAVADDKSGVTKISASRDKVNVNGMDVNVEASHEVKSHDSKLKLSSVLGHGVTATSTTTVAKGGARSTDVELEYENELTNGRSITASVKPQSGTGEIEYVDSKTVDATITASMDLGGKPKVTVKRAWGF
jgi:hypothetical protein